MIGKDPRSIGYYTRMNDVRNQYN